ncbi:MAG: DUF4185 domain-containing protein [Acholeplasmataceae bacterium]|nr:DUF4185 domain-containing protein [Acholeplasmataceae bacterium]
MKKGQIITSFEAIHGIHEIKLDHIYPIGDIKGDIEKVVYFIDDQEQKSHYANRLMIHSNEKQTIDIQLGQGYVATPDETWTNQFLHDTMWSGGDGIFTFNMDNGNDAFDQNGLPKTLFVFGDTFIGTSNKETKQRYQPHLMANNTLAYLEDGKLEFRIAWNADGSMCNFYEIEPKYDLSGTVPFNLVNYDRKGKNDGWVSGYHPKQIELTFDLFTPRHVSHIHVQNYWSDAFDGLSKRGVKSIVINGSDDQKHWQEIGTFTIHQSTQKEAVQSLEIHAKFRYFKWVIFAELGIGNYNDETFKEGLFALSKVEFFNDQQLYRDIEVHSTSTLLANRDHSWIWLQDGVVIGNQLYFIPIIINSDKSQPEGLQFRVVAAALFKTAIKNKELDFSQVSQKRAPLLVENGDSNWLFGSALMASTKQAGATHPDGYIYIYGYKTTFGLRELLVARVEENRFEYFDDWRYYDGKSWVCDLFAAKPLLEHVSCEMSVSELLSGSNQGKYMAVYTYDTNTPYVAFSIGETPWGPFSEPQTIYHTPEQDIFKSTTYTYNAKAHPHLSKSDDVLVTYNTNTYNFEHNMSNYHIYRARFIRLKDTDQ